KIKKFQKQNGNYNNFIELRRRFT
ncbi:PTS sugar transporter subunit IIA, partial [Listeria monocytogenes]|nr:PTS sugar transporter subunit IIA [Listeria monocytogenes]